MIQKIELSAALNSLATQSNIDKVTGMLGSSAANISKADLATVVAEVLNFSNGVVIGTNRDNVTTIARDVIDALPIKEFTRFSYIHDYYGKRLVEGYIYSNKNYGVVLIKDFLKGTNVVVINNGEYIAK